MIVDFIYLLIFSTLVKARDPLGNDISGDEQIGIVNQFLKKPLVVRIVDEKGIGIPETPVIFSILKEPSENLVSNHKTVIEPETVYTDYEGYAKTNVRVGSARGDYYITARHNNEMLVFHITGLRRDWILMLVVSLIGGLALFIFGMNYGSKGLIRGLGYKTRDLLFNLTSKNITALLSGLVVTVIFGSCTATASLLIKFVSAGFVQSISALAILLGANIGATITVQILSFNIMDYALIIVATGVFLRMLFSNFRNIAQFIFGFGLLFFSLKIISMGINDVKYLPGFSGFISYLDKNIILAILFGAVGSFIFRSSTAVIGLILVLGFESVISTKSAFNLLLGANIGATIFPILISDSIYAKRVTLGNFIFKFVGALILLFLINNLYFTPPGDNVARQIANLHTIFNLLAAFLFLPLLNPFARLMEFLIPETKENMLRIRRLDPSYIDTPAIGIAQAMMVIIDMAEKTIKMLEDSIKVFEKKDIVLRKEIIQSDDDIDRIEESVNPYLSRLNPEEMDQGVRKMQIGLLTITAELEHIGDIISKNLMSYAKKQIDEGMEFSAEGFAQIKEFHKFVLDTLRMAISSLTTRDKKLAKEVIHRRKKGLDIVKDFEIKHLERLHRGLKESLETSTIHLDILSDLERINFHATEIAGVVEGFV
uniref:Na/Pi cotransporter family protein n=1 Tax=candidate division WOR-3 bacterium TaxID=2052148 RepID=A0A7V3RHP8_UNCW3